MQAVAPGAEDAPGLTPDGIGAAPSPSGQASRLRFERSDLIIRTAGSLMRQARLVDAEALLRDVLARNPENVDAWTALASVRERIGDTDGAVALFDRALELAPTNLAVLSGAIFAADRRPDATLEDGYRIRRRYHEIVKRPVRPHANDRAPERKLRVGYVSGDFRHHSAALVWGPVLLKHDRASVEPYCYSTIPTGDWMTEQLYRSVQNWRNVSQMDDDAMEQLIREDRIDILVDLSGHSAGNRLPVFARKPAPVQVTAWGYITGTGLDAIDYLFADADTVYDDEERWYAEEVVRLPRIVTYWPADPELVGAVQEPPFRRNGHLTYGVVNRLGKLKRGAVALWARVLRAVPDARLIVKAPGLDDREARDYLQAVFAEEGADLGRVQFRGQTPHAEHMQAYNEIDVCLDPWPDGGGVSTLEALWMGVPCVTFPYRQIASRLTASFNNEVGLPWLNATSPDEYVERAADLDRQRDELAAVRRHLRDVLSMSVLGDAEAYTRHVEDAYRWMWRRWCADERAPRLRVVAP